MEKIHSWCGQPSDQERLKNRTEINKDKTHHRCRHATSSSVHMIQPLLSLQMTNLNLPFVIYTDAYNSSTKRWM